MLIYLENDVVKNVYEFFRDNESRREPYNIEEAVKKFQDAYEHLTADEAQYKIGG